jgi:hypothetical protein
VDLAALNNRIAAVEAAAQHAAVSHLVVMHELDRLAEHLVGDSSPELQGPKHRIQELIARVAPERHDVPSYVEIYCHGSGGR